MLLSRECGDARVCVIRWRHAAWGLIYCTSASTISDLRMVKRGVVVYRWSDEKLKSGLGMHPKG